MAINDHGTAHLYGVSGTITNATVISTSFEHERVNAATTEDESGNQIERRYDDTHDRGSITLRIQSAYTIPTAGATITYDSLEYEITSVSEPQEQKGFREITVNVLKSEFITY